MVVGSDAVYNGWGLNMRELDWFVKMGMTPAQALKAATTEPAAMLGMEKSLGAVAPGFYADIVAVARRPPNRHHRSFEQGKRPLGDESGPRRGRQNEKRALGNSPGKTTRLGITVASLPGRPSASAWR